MKKQYSEPQLNIRNNFRPIWDGGCWNPLSCWRGGMTPLQRTGLYRTVSTTCDTVPGPMQPVYYFLVCVLLSHGSKWWQPNQNKDVTVKPWRVMKLFLNQGTQAGREQNSVLLTGFKCVMAYRSAKVGERKRGCGTPRRGINLQE